MHRIIRHRPSPAMIVACIALVLSLAGTGYAAIVLPAGSVGTQQLKTGAVTTAKVKTGAVTSAKVRTGAITSAKVKNYTLTLADIKASALSSLGRVGLGSGSTTIGAGATGTVATVSLTAPTTGFVLVNGWIDTFGANGAVGVRVWDDTAATHSPYNNTDSPSGDEWAIGNIGVFPVTAGARTFSVRLDWNASSTPVDCWATITAQFIPYGATGSKTSLAITKNRNLAPPQH